MNILDDIIEGVSDKICFALYSEATDKDVLPSLSWAKIRADELIDSGIGNGIIGEIRKTVIDTTIRKYLIRLDYNFLYDNYPFCFTDMVEAIGKKGKKISNNSEFDSMFDSIIKKDDESILVLVNHYANSLGLYKDLYELIRDAVLKNAREIYNATSNRAIGE